MRGGIACPDRERQELPSLKTALAEAVNSNRENLGERILQGGMIDLRRQFEIADQTGAVLATVTATDVLMQSGQPRGFANDVTQSAPIAKVSSAG